MRVGVGLQPAEGEGDTPSDRIGQERWGVERACPIGFVDGQASCAQSVQPPGVEGARLAGGVVCLNSPLHPLWRHLDHLCQPADSIGLVGLFCGADGALPGVRVFCARFVIEQVEGHSTLVVHDGLAELHVSLVAEVLAFVQKPLTVFVDEETKLEDVDRRHSTLERSGAGVEDRGMEVSPLPGGHGPNLQGHLQPLAGVIAGAAQDDVVHVAAEVAHTHLHIGLEAPAGDHHAPAGFDVSVAVRLQRADTNHSSCAIREQLLSCRPVGYVHAAAFQVFIQCINQLPATTHGLPAVACHVGITLLPLHAELGEPVHHVRGVVHNHPDEVLVRPAAGHPQEGVEEIFLGLPRRAILVRFVGIADLGISNGGVAAAL